MKPLLVVMGVAGSGKSTIEELIASHLEVPFIDGDSLHPASNVAKMAAGNPLSDDDRWPWLGVRDLLGLGLAELPWQRAIRRQIDRNQRPHRGIAWTRVLVSRHRRRS
ncbi:MAG: hypothetical protein ACR2NT_03555, partial [Acidimicrobiia bacterium]